MKQAGQAANFIKESGKMSWHDETLWQVREKRDAAADELPEWETLRERASAIKSHTLSRLDYYLEQFEKKALENGIHVHWAENAQEHNHIVKDILDRHQLKEVVKSKSMLTEECGLNEYLEEAGIEVVDTDLGERIIQLKREKPSHIVLPAVHLRREEVGELFAKKLKSQKGNSDPQYLAEVARKHLQKKIRNAKAAISGVNFAIAETGSITVCTNEGNADLALNSARVQIHCLGIEKLIPKWNELGVFTRLLARSATGQAVTVYTSHYARARKDGEMHIVLVDNGRSEHLGKDDFRDGLKCIRCGACMNTCPVYRRSGGHSYHATVPGPIGSILNPRTDLEAYSDLPFASTLCGSCSDVCPVKIDIHEQLYKWRQLINANKEDRLISAAAKLLADANKMRCYGAIARFAQRISPAFIKRLLMPGWIDFRELPNPPKQSFGSWYRKNRGNEI